MAEQYITLIGVAAIAATAAVLIIWTSKCGFCANRGYIPRKAGGPTFFMSAGVLFAQEAVIVCEHCKKGRALKEQLLDKPKFHGATT